ncbi:MAG: sialate O-acetylesterase [Crocinitomicaceae bacterium]
MKPIVIFLLSFLATMPLIAEISLPEILGDHMVLQQNSVVKFWGTSSTKTTVSVRVSWTNTVFSCTPKPDGSWELSVFTPKGSFNKHNIIISDGVPITLKNILIGEVWFCSGQSNMAMTFTGYKKEPVANANEELIQANEESGIRMFNVEKYASYELIVPAKGDWLVSSSQNLANFSAVAYYYAVNLQKELQVPIGIINSSYGGSTIEGWLNQGNIQKYDDYPMNPDIPDSESYLRPNVMFQGMVRPFRNYTIKGIIWYQGESNVGRPTSYTQKLIDLVYLLRFTFDSNELPFYVVEIAPYRYEGITDPAKLREAQFKATQSLYYAGIISTNDLVPEAEANCIHPSNKKSVGERLANLALLETYQFDTIPAHSPHFTGMEIKGNSVVLSFDHTYDGLHIEGDEITGFEVGNEQHEFHPVQAKLGKEANTIEIQIGYRTPNPAVRYCFKNYQVGNVKNSAGLPLIPFRTDNWAE